MQCKESYHSHLITLSPLEFQQTSKMPPVPLYEWTSCPFWVLQMWTHLLDNIQKEPVKNYEITCRSCHWRGTFHRGRTPHCTLAPCAWVGTHCHYHSLSKPANFEKWEQKRCFLLMMFFWPTWLVCGHLSPSLRPTTELLSQRRRSPEPGSCSDYLCLRIFNQLFPLSIPTWSCGAPFYCVNLFLVRR